MILETYKGGVASSGMMFSSYFKNMKVSGIFQSYSRSTQPGTGRIAQRQSRDG